MEKREYKNDIIDGLICYDYKNDTKESWDKLCICTNCNKYFVVENEEKSFDVYRYTLNLEEYECPHCHTTHKNIINKYRFYKNYNNEFVYGVIKDVTFDKKHFIMHYDAYNNNIFINNENEIEMTSSIDNVVIEMKFEPYKTKEGEKFIATAYKNDEKIRFTANSLGEVIYNCINEHVLADLKLASGGACLKNQIISIKDCLTKYPEFIDLDLMPIYNKENADPILKRIEKSDFYYHKVLEYVNKSTLECRTCYAEDILREFPTINEKYYELYDYFKNKQDYYITYSIEYNLSYYCLMFNEYNYTIEEADLLFQYIYKQNICHNIANQIKKAHKIYISIDVPIIKVPKELDIYIDRAITISKRLENTETHIKREDFTYLIYNKINYHCEIEKDCKKTIKKILSYKNNFNLLNKMLYLCIMEKESYANYNVILNIKDTDYFIIKRRFKKEEEESSVLHMFYKTEEITNPIEIENILQATVNKKEEALLTC